MSAELEFVVEELAVAERDLATSERADLDGRVTGEPEWARSLRRKRDRVRELTERRDRMVAEEEAEAELADSGRDE